MFGRRFGAMGGRARGLWVALALLAPGAVDAAPPASPSPEALRDEIKVDGERARVLDDRSEGLRSEIESLRATLVETADALRAREAELDDVEERVRALEARERSQLDRLEVERGRAATVLNALVGAARLPPEAVLVRPGSPLDALRALGALGDTLTPLRERAAAVEAAVADLRATRTQLVGERDRAREARTALDARRAEVERLVRRREELNRLTADERQALARRMAALTDRVADLRQLVERVEHDRRDEPRDPAPPSAERVERPPLVALSPAPPPPPPATNPASDMGFPRPPIGGRIAVRFGQEDGLGGVARGMTLVGRPGDPATAPGNGVVVFAGPFRGHGLVLIVDHRNGYHSLIAGMGRVDVTVGRAVAIGEPVGVLPDGDGEAPELYFELRRDGKPTNPQRGSGAAETKGRG